MRLSGGDKQMNMQTLSYKVKIKKEDIIPIAIVSGLTTLLIALPAVAILRGEKPWWAK